VSNEANIDLTSISSWFGEENFTYIRVLVSITYPHVLPLHIPDKLLPMEIAYQIVEKGMTRNLKDSKKKVWPPFPLRYGTYTLHDFKHAEKEVEKTKDLNLAVIPKRQYDPNKVAYNFTIHVKISKFIHEEDEFDDFFASTELFSQVTHLERFKLGATKMDKFMEYRT